MLGLVTTLNDMAPMELREVPEPQTQRSEALVAVGAFSLNRGELALLERRPAGRRWQSSGCGRTRGGADR